MGIDRVRRASAVSLEQSERAGGHCVARGGLALWRAKRVAAYIESNISLSLHVADLAGIVRLSTAHFSRAFSTSFGQPPRAYITARRIHHAQLIMVSTQEPLSRIALDCGMNDQAHFSRVFRRVVGTTPGLWRRQFQSGTAATQLDGSVANFEDALQHHTRAYRKARHTEDQASRCLVSSEYTDI
jgi:AraC-like DNA-binding protein